METGVRAGWYAVPGGFAWWDGSRWTGRFQPPMPPVNHVLHLLLTVLTFGLWAPVWVVLVWQRDRESRRRAQPPV